MSKCFQCVYFSKDLGSSQVRCRHPDRIPKLLFSLLPARGNGATKDDLHPKITWTMPLTRAVNMNGRFSSFSKSVLLTCSVFSAVNQCLEKGLENIHHDQEVRSIGTIHYFSDNVLYDAAHTSVILMRCYSSRPCLVFFDGGWDVWC